MINHKFIIVLCFDSIDQCDPRIQTQTEIVVKPNPFLSVGNSCDTVIHVADSWLMTHVPFMTHDHDWLLIHCTDGCIRFDGSRQVWKVRVFKFHLNLNCFNIKIKWQMHSIDSWLHYVCGNWELQSHWFRLESGPWAAERRQRMRRSSQRLWLHLLQNLNLANGLLRRRRRMRKNPMAKVCLWTSC